MAKDFMKAIDKTNLSKGIAALIGKRSEENENPAKLVPAYTGLIQRFNLKLSKDLKDNFEIYCIKSGHSMNKVINELISDYLDGKKVKQGDTTGRLRSKKVDKGFDYVLSISIKKELHIGLKLYCKQNALDLQSTLQGLVIDFMVDKKY